LYVLLPLIHTLQFLSGLRHNGIETDAQPTAEAPEGYNSVQGVSARHGRPSAFTDDEYVVYNIEQQQMEYLVEFRLTSSVRAPCSCVVW
jgi:hypothetical protein